MTNTHSLRSSTLNKYEINKIRRSEILCYLVAIIPLVSAFISGIFVQILENEAFSPEELFEMTTNITIYSVALESIGIGKIILQILILFFGLKILARQLGVGQRIGDFAEEVQGAV